MAIKSVEYDKNVFEKLKTVQYAKDWPVVYILENGKEMYVGETVSARNRFKQHYEKEERKRLTTAHIITDEEYNKSATLDIESWLIQYLVADNIFTLQNNNKGLKNHSYYDRAKYEAKFQIIWKELQKKGLAKRELVQLKNTDLFKYSPYKSLTVEQIKIVEEIEYSLVQNKNQTYIINGEPGTGKSVLGTYLIKYLLSQEDTKNLNIALVVPMSSLRTTLKKVFSKVAGLKSSMVVGPNQVVGKKYDLLIVDEAHRLRRRINLANYGSYDKVNRDLGLDNSGTQLDWIMRSSKSQILLYDGNQSVVPGDIRPQDIEGLHPKRFELTNQLRVLAGNDYVNYIENILNTINVERPDFGEYDLRYFSDINEMITEIKKKDKAHGLARLVAGYAWTWESKKPNSQDYDIELDGLKLKWNSTNIDWVNSKDALDEVGCIHTVQGYDLNYVGVIIGPEMAYDPKNHKLIIDKSKYKDFNGKRSIESPEELEKYIINIYKTLLTRGIKGTYIHAVDKGLEKFISTIVN